MHLNLSIIIAVYERQEELKELLFSLTQQEDTHVEVVVVDDGSITNLKPVIDLYASQLKIAYYKKENSGPGLSRNYGMHKATGDYFIFLDSDTILPSHYIQEVKAELKDNYVDFFGGSDASSQHFTALQKAINFSMTSFWTTGGIRGGKQKVGKFQPRSFNMGMSRQAFEVTGGFSHLRVGEDPDLTLTLWEKGFKSRWFPNAYVYHKRRTSIKQFGGQVKAFGIARPILNKRHPQYTSITFWFPTVFIIAFIMAWVLCFSGNFYLLMFYGFYFIFIGIASSIQNQSIKVGLLSCVTTFIQFEMYGFGFLRSQIRLNVLGQKPEEAFPSHFYKT